MDTDIEDFNNISEPVTTSYGLNYELESVSIDGDGRIMQERNGDSIKYRYDYYLKDHLGSTRMVFNDQQTVTEQINYQAYGTIQPLDSAAPSLPAREKYTGKEYDVQGADFARIEYDISVSGFTRRNSGNVGSLRVTYKDIAAGSMYQKVYGCRVDSAGSTLRFTGSESFNSNTEIERIRLTAYGATYTISNSVPFDSLIVNTGKTRRVEMSVTSGEITSAPVDSNFYTLAADEDNTAYFSGTKLFYFGARFYDPELGIWLSVDPASQFANAYAYAGNGANPVIMVDEDGNFIFSTLALALIGASAAISGTMTAVKVAESGGNFGQVLLGFGFGAIAGAVGGVAGAATGGAATAGITTALGSFGSTFAGGLVGATVGGSFGGLVGGAASGLTGGFTTSLIITGDIKIAMRSGAIGMINGMGTGMVIGGLSGAAGYSIGKGFEALRNSKNVGNLPKQIAKVTQKIDPNTAKEVAGVSADKVLDISSNPPIEDPMKPLPEPEIYDIKKYYKVTNPTSQPQPPVIKLPVPPIKIPTTPVQMSPVNINPLPPGVTSAGNGGFYMITPNADFYYSF